MRDAHLSRRHFLAGTAAVATVGFPAVVRSQPKEIIIGGAASHKAFMVPVLAPAFLTSGLFAFLASMDNYPISIFLVDARNKTLPILMLQYLEENPDPTIAAISSGLIVLTIVVLLVADRLVGLRRLADF